jgi:proteasome accessory factor B
MGTRLINRTERLAVIEQMLFRSVIGLRAVEIAEACGVDRRTVYRDLSLLGEIGVPIFQKDGRFFIEREHYLANVRLSLNEAAALLMAARVFSQHSDQQHPSIVSVLRKLSRALPDPSASYVNHIIETAHNGAVDPGFVSVLDTVIRAWSEGCKIKLWYNSLVGEATTREFAIYFIEATPKAQLYIVGFDSLTQRIRAFMLNRIKRVKLLRNTYSVPSQFNFRRYLSNAWGMPISEEEEIIEVALLFSSSAAPFIKERVWHSGQLIEVLEDERCILRVSVTDWREMLPWVRMWGAEVEVLQPQALRDLLAEEALQVASLYGELKDHMSLTG